MGNAVSSHIFAIFAAECSALDIFPAVALCKSGNRVSQLRISFAVDLALCISGNGDSLGGDLAGGIHGDGGGGKCVTGSQANQAAEGGGGDFCDVGTVENSA